MRNGSQKFNILVILVSMLLSTIISIQAAPIQSLRSGAYFAGTDGTCRFEKPGDPDWIFERFTYIMGYADCPNWIDEWRLKSPQCQLTLYISGTDLPAYKSSVSNTYNIGKKSTWIRDRMVALGDIEENAYMHFYEDTKLRWYSDGWDTLLIPGTYSMTITAGDSVSRVPNGYVNALFVNRNTYQSPARLSPNFTNANLRLAYKEYICQIFDETGDTEHWPGKNGYWDGVYFDNYSHSGLMGNHFASGGRIVETGTSPENLLIFATNPYRDWGWEWMKTFGREIRDTLQMGEQWTADGKKKSLSYNIGISHRDAYIDPAESGADAINVEFGYDPVYSNSKSYYRLENIHTRDSIAVLNGVTYFWCSIPRKEYGGRGNVTKREAIYNNLCFYYAARTESTWIYMRPDPGFAYGAFLNSGYDTLSWVPAMEYDLGAPSFHYDLATSGSSPDESGSTYKVWQRDYTYAKVFMRPRDGFDAKWGDQSTPITVELGATYRKLNIDGSLGDPVTEISLRGAEGAIMFPTETGDCDIPPTVPQLYSPASGSTVSTVSPDLCTNNSTQSNCVLPIRYHFQVSAQSNFSSIVTENNNVTEGSSVSCWTVPVSLNPGGLYYWRVKAENGISVSNWSSTRSFTVSNDPPSVPTPTSPSHGGNVGSTQPNLIVLNSTDPEGQNLTYHFQLSRYSGLSPLHGENTSVTEGSGSTSWQVSPTLTDGLVYYWHVRAYDGANYSSWCSTRSFTVNLSSGNSPPSTPSVNWPSNNDVLNDLSPTLSVNNSTDPDGNDLTYKFEVYDSTFSTLIAESGMVTEGSATTNWTTPSLPAEIKYSWQVRSYDGQEYSSWMPVSYFIVSNQQNLPPSVPVPISPVDGDTIFGSIHILAVNNSIDPEGAPLTYDFVVFGDPELTQLVEFEVALPETDPITIFYTDGNYNNGHSYYWRARAYDGDRWTNYSNPRSFFHLDLTLDVTDICQLVYPSDNLVIKSTQPTFRVVCPYETDSTVCIFEVSKTPDFNDPVAAGWAIAYRGSSEWKTNVTLEDDNIYYWRAGYNGNNYSDVGSFTIGASIYVHPNPFSYFDGEMVIHNIPENSKFIVYTVAGEKVFEINNVEGDYTWNVLNSSGEKLASGVYLYYVITGNDKYGDKFIIVR